MVIVAENGIRMSEAEFTIAGVRKHLSASQVKRAVRGVEPKTLQSHAVEIGGRLYPVKQAFSAATGLDLLDFTTDQSRRILRRLGFKVVRLG